MAVENITMPQLGESVTEGTISKWLVNVGDHVNKYDPLAEVMTDKVNAEVPSSFTGIVKELIAGEGDTLAVGEVVCVIQVEGADEVAATAVEEKTKEEPKAEVNTPEKAPKAKQPTDGKPRFSPAVLKLAGEHNVDLDLVEGTEQTAVSLVKIF